MASSDCAREERQREGPGKLDLILWNPGNCRDRSGFLLRPPKCYLQYPHTLLPPCSRPTSTVLSKAPLVPSGSPASTSLCRAYKCLHHFTALRLPRDEALPVFPAIYTPGPSEDTQLVFRSFLLEVSKEKKKNLSFGIS